MAALVETALDLSSKSSSSRVGSRASSVDTSRRTSPSPVPSMTSSEGTEERASSVSSSSSESRHVHRRLSGEFDRASPSSIKSGSLPSLHLSSDNASLPTDTSKSAQVPANMRPFKMYPFDPITSMPGLGSSPSSAAGLYQMGSGLLGHPALANSSALSPSVPLVGSAMPSLSPSMLDATAALPLSTPIAQYLQQRKRRQESRMSNGGSATSLGSRDSSGSTDDLVSMGNEEKRPKLETEDENYGLEERRDGSYWERRRKNNEAAKRSRDARRAKEEEIAFRAAFLEQENLKLRAQVAILKNETAKLHYMLYNRL